MARDLTAGWIANATARVCRPVIFFEATFISNTLRLWSGIGETTWNSQIWQGNGWLQEPEFPEETDDIEANGMEIILAGVPGAVVSLALQEGKQGASGKVWFGFLNADGTVVDSPYLVFDGKFDYCDITESVAGSIVKIQYETHLLDMERPKEFRYNPRSQALFFPDDRGFEYVDQLQGKNLYWGNKKKEPKKKERTKVKQGKGNRKNKR